MFPKKNVYSQIEQWLSPVSEVTIKNGPTMSDRTVVCVDADFVDLETYIRSIEIKIPEIKQVIFNDPATIVLWADDTKTVVKAGNGDVFNPEVGLAMAISKKALGNKGNYNNVMKKWLPKEGKE